MERKDTHEFPKTVKKISQTSKQKKKFIQALQSVKSQSHYVRWSALHDRGLALFSAGQHKHRGLAPFRTLGYRLLTRDDSSN